MFIQVSVNAALMFRINGGNRENIRDNKPNMGTYMTFP